MEPFARDIGYEGNPFIWDEEDRRHRWARLDALFFLLYGISQADIDYILNQFPIVREDDEKEFGRFRTRDLITPTSRRKTSVQRWPMPPASCSEHL